MAAMLGDNKHIIKHQQKWNGQEIHNFLNGIITIVIDEKTFKDEILTSRAIKIFGRTVYHKSKIEIKGRRISH